MHQRLSIYSPPSAYFEIRNTLKKLLFKNSSIFYLIFFRVRNWAQKLGGELWHFGELVTRRTMVIDVSKILICTRTLLKTFIFQSFKDTTIVREDGEALLKDIHERITHMMKQKVEAVKVINEEFIIRND